MENSEDAQKSYPQAKRDVLDHWSKQTYRFRNERILWMTIEKFAEQEALNTKPDASRELEFMAPAIIEIIEGARSVTQLGGLINEDVYQMLRKKAIDTAHRRRAMGLKPVDYPKIEIADIHQESNRTGQIESIVLLRFRGRLRAMTIRLERRVGRWLATAITIL